MPVKLPWQVGDRLWVREAFGAPGLGFDAPPHYRADDDRPEIAWTWKPSIHMPRRYSRLTLTVTERRVQRLQEITWEDAESEGVWFGSQEYRDQVCIWRDAPNALRRLRIEEYQRIWNSLHGPDAWDLNPWVCALTFTVEHRNIDVATASGNHER